ncbi:TetR/AcrR family transcriptional regulator [Streptomyces sp. RG80]|uniref:TetR/AcrR family transcriptional regulator n=1 Tax=Streptomyces sp. RG80 TaxID=3157340 RepID=UPI00338D3633
MSGHQEQRDQQDSQEKESQQREAREKEAQPRRRQARGERRVAQLLEAAAAVFCTTGYTAASTNAIAREAGVSPGTLYQFFPNKEAIAIELGDRLMHEMRDAYGEALAPIDPATPLEEAVGAAVDRFIDFNCRHPVFFALMHGPDVPGRLTEKHDALHETLLGRIESLLTSFLPEAPRADILRTGQMVLGIYMAGLDLVLAHEGAERDAFVQELKYALIRYLDPLVGDRLGRTGSVTATPAAD